jgi:hypothetical protein
MLEVKTAPAERQNGTVRGISIGYIVKGPGDTFGATVSFSHRGKGRSVWVGIGLAYGLGVGHNPPMCYAMKQITLPDHLDWTPYSENVTGTIPLDVQLGKLLDVQVFISDSKPVVGQQPPNPWDVNGWIGEDVYGTLAVTAFQSLSATYW